MSIGDALLVAALNIRADAVRANGEADIIAASDLVRRAAKTMGTPDAEIDQVLAEQEQIIRDQNAH